MQRIITEEPPDGEQGLHMLVNHRQSTWHAHIPAMDTQRDMVAIRTGNSRTNHHRLNHVFVVKSLYTVNPKSRQ